MERCDVLVVGGGPAGSTCAGELKRHGFDVMVLDQKSFPRDKVCAGWITPAVLDALSIDHAEYSASRVLQPITGFRTGIIGGTEVETRYAQAVSYGIRRREFDHYLLDRSGARLQLGEPLRSIERSGDGWLVNGKIQARLLVGAGGHFCPVARLLGARSSAPESVVAAKEIEFPMDTTQQTACRVQGETPELFFCEDLLGYGWCFRKGNHLNIGLGREDKHGLTQHLQAFCTFLKDRGRIPENIPDAFHGHAYMLHGRSARNLVSDGALLIGDAAGLAYPESGEGIRPAVESALLAARTVVEADGDYRARRLAPYARRLTSRFGEAGAAERTPQTGLRRYIGSALLSSAWFTRHVVLDRWFLHTRQEALHPS